MKLLKRGDNVVFLPLWQNPGEGGKLFVAMFDEEKGTPLLVANPQPGVPPALTPTEIVEPIMIDRDLSGLDNYAKGKFSWLKGATG